MQTGTMGGKWSHFAQLCNCKHNYVCVHKCMYKQKCWLFLICSVCVGGWEEGMVCVCVCVCVIECLPLHTHTLTFPQAMLCQSLCGIWYNTCKCTVYIHTYCVGYCKQYSTRYIHNNVYWKQYLVYPHSTLWQYIQPILSIQ